MQHTPFPHCAKESCKSEKTFHFSLKQKIFLPNNYTKKSDSLFTATTKLSISSRKRVARVLFPSICDNDMIHEFQKIGRHMEKLRSVLFLIFEGKAFPWLALRCSPPLLLRGYMQNDASHIKAYQSFAYTPLKSPTLN